MALAGVVVVADGVGSTRCVRRSCGTEVAREGVVDVADNDGVLDGDGVASGGSRDPPVPYLERLLAASSLRLNSSFEMKPRWPGKWL